MATDNYNKILGNKETIRKQESNMRTIAKYKETKRQQENKKGLTTRK